MLAGFSPIFVGAVVAIVVSQHRCPPHLWFQSPIRRGGRCNCPGAGRGGGPLWFQSPIRRGGRCNRLAALEALLQQAFQSPIRRGGRCNAWQCWVMWAVVAVSVPYSSGRSLQFGNSVVASFTGEWFQSPIRRGGRCNIRYDQQYYSAELFQSPIRRGRRCNSSVSGCSKRRCSFSPLFVGAGVAMPARAGAGAAHPGFSPLFVGAGVAMVKNRGKFHILPQFC